MTPGPQHSACYRFRAQHRQSVVSLCLGNAQGAPSATSHRNQERLDLYYYLSAPISKTPIYIGWCQYYSPGDRKPAGPPSSH